MAYQLIMIEDKARLALRVDEPSVVCPSFLADDDLVLGTGYVDGGELREVVIF